MAGGAPSPHPPPSAPWDARTKRRSTRARYAFLLGPNSPMHGRAGATPHVVHPTARASSLAAFARSRWFDSRASPFSPVQCRPGAAEQVVHPTRRRMKSRTSSSESPSTGTLRSEMRPSRAGADSGSSHSTFLRPSTARQTSWVTSWSPRRTRSPRPERLTRSRHGPAGERRFPPGPWCTHRPERPGGPGRLPVQHPRLHPPAPGWQRALHLRRRQLQCFNGAELAFCFGPGRAVQPMPCPCSRGHGSATGRWIGWLSGFVNNKCLLPVTGSNPQGDGL